MLITLVIIGIIAALTIPNLLQKYQEQATVKKVQKFYSNLSNAYSLAMKENGPANEWGLTMADNKSATKIYELLLKPYFKIAKNCGFSNKENCLANNTYTLLNNKNSQNYATSSKHYKIVLDDNSAVWVREAYIEGSTHNAYIDYDVNGHKGPNQWGKDTFEFFIRNDKVAPSGIPSGPYRLYSFNSTCKTTSTGEGCAAWVIYKGNMDYLHCDGLTWNSRSCKDK